MPHSYTLFKKEVKEFILEQIPTHCHILDIGAGVGTYSDLLRKHGYFMSGVEIYQPYVDKYNLKEKYDILHVENILNINNFDHYHLVIMGDILEHLTYEDARKIIDKYLNQHSKMIVAVPYMMQQSEYDGNIYEVHLQPDLTPQVMQERYPEFELLYGDDMYGYYISKNFWDYEKAFVLSTDKAYMDLADLCIQSIQKYTDIPILLYQINADFDDDSYDWIPSYGKSYQIKWEAKNVHGFKYRNDFIDRSDINIYKLLIQRPKIVHDSLRRSRKVAYIDSDSIATKNCNKIFDYYDNQNYPLFTEGIYDYLMVNGRGGALSKDDLSKTLEAPICDLFGINQYVRNKYRQTGYFVAGQNSKDFLKEWAWMCEHPEIMKNNAHYAEFNEETVVNALLWKYNIQESLPYCYINGLHDNLEYKNHEYFLKEWQKVPLEQNHFFYHGEKNINKLNNFIK
jgi:hypothetical protein